MELVYFFRFIPILFFLHPFIKAYRRKNKIAMLVCGLYLGSSIGALFISEEYLIWHDFKTDTFFGFLLFAVANLPLLYLSLKIQPISNVEGIELDKVSKVFLTFLGVGAVYSVIYQIPYVLTSMSMSAYEVRNMEESVLPPSIFTTIAVGFPMFLFVYVFFFYLSIVKGWSLLLKSTMLLGAINFVLNVLTASGRDGFVFFILAFVFGYLLFENHLSEKEKSKIKSLAVLFIGVGVLIIGTITLDRFSRLSGISLNFVFQVGILNYLSMQVFTFNDMLKHHHVFEGGKDIFPFFYSLFMDLGVQERDVSMPYMWNFAGYVGSFYMSGGLIFMAIVLLVFVLIFNGLRLVSRSFYLYGFGILSFYLFFMTSGLFYFRMGNKGGNLFILLSILMMFLFRRKPVFRLKKQ